MNSTWLALAQGYAGVAAFALFFLPSGFLVAFYTNFHGFRTRSRAEKLLWSILFSIPIAIEICVGLGRLLPAVALLSLFLVLAVAALATLLLTRSPSTPATGSRTTRIAFALAGALGLYFIATSTDIQIGHHLYIAGVFSDWSVRIAMVATAMRSGVPPLNGLSALTGTPASLRYFYYWYVVCADLARFLHIPARAGLAASCVWASWGLLSVFFLSLKYLLGITRDLRRYCLFGFLALAVMGLDLIPTARLLLIPRLHPFPEIEWWHQDRTPSLLSATLFAPHHIASFTCLLGGLLVVALSLRQKDEPPVPLSQWIFTALFAGLCFGAAAGTAILPTVIIAIVCLVWVADLLRQRQFRTIGALAVSAVLALLLAHSFLHELQSNTGAASGPPVAVHWRNTDLIQSYQEKYSFLTSSHAPIRWAIFLAGTLAVNFLDLSFFFFVLVHRLRRDWNRTLTPGERATWAFFVGTSIPYFFLTTRSIASPNDLGVDAGFLLRLLLQLWAVPWLYTLGQERRAAQQQGVIAPKPGLFLRLANICLVLGLATSLVQVIWERVYFPLLSAQVIHKRLDLFTTDRLSERLYNIREAYRALDHTPNAPLPTASIQYNPISVMQPALTFYTTHQIAAFDIGCGTGYGGDYDACKAIMPELLALYGNTMDGFNRGLYPNDRQDNAAPKTATDEDARSICRTLHLSTLIAESTDSIWSRPNSWVWTMTPIAANPTVRVFACPTPPAN